MSVKSEAGSHAANTGANANANKSANASTNIKTKWSTNDTKAAYGDAHVAMLVVVAYKRMLCRAQSVVSSVNAWPHVTILVHTEQTTTVNILLKFRKLNKICKCY